MGCFGFVFKLGCRKATGQILYQIPDLGVSWKSKDTEGVQGEDWSVRGMRMGEMWMEVGW